MSKNSLKSNVWMRKNPAERVPPPAAFQRTESMAGPECRSEFMASAHVSSSVAACTSAMNKTDDRVNELTGNRSSKERDQSQPWGE